MRAVAVFIDPKWVDHGSLRRWVRTLTPETCIWINDDLTEGNRVLARSCMCVRLPTAIFRMPSIPKNLIEWAEAQKRRDETMAALAASVVDFGDLPGGLERFPGKTVEHYALGRAL